MSKYAIGLDFGTLSCRGVLARVSDGAELAVSVFEYPHGVMAERLPTGEKLAQDWAIEHPRDYLDALQAVIPDIVRQAGVRAEDIVGLGLDTTGCSPMPVLADGTPLCFLREFEREPHAYIKLWKHHAAQKYADRLNAVAAERGERWLARYGGRISSEWFFPKLWQILEEAPQVYERMAHFIEVADWLTWQLTGMPVKNACYAGYKAMWNQRTGYPDPSFFKALDPRLEHVIANKVSLPVMPQGACAGEISPEMAESLGLKPGTPVAVGNSDALVNVPAAKISDAGKMLAVMGTSTCHMILGDAEREVPGICGCVENGILPGFFGYEAGQNCVGDHFGWFVKNCVPESYFAQAAARQMDIHAWLQELASQLAPGESGLLALDWWNGNRSVLVDADLTGLMLGMTLRTRPEEIYRALIEATAFGTRMIIENYERHGVPVREFYATGGIASKSPFIMQLYADVIRRTIRISGGDQGPALASAMFGAAVAGRSRGGWDDIAEAAEAMGRLRREAYVPNAERSAVYDELYREFVRLHDYFGRGGNDVMKRLKQLSGGDGSAEGRH